MQMWKMYDKIQWLKTRNAKTFEIKIRDDLIIHLLGFFQIDLLNIYFKTTIYNQSPVGLIMSFCEFVCAAA